MILVTGASGKTGRAILRALTTRRLAVRAFVRRAEQAEPLQAMGVNQVVTGDIGDASALTGATRGIRALYHICPNVHPDEVSIGQAVINAARESGLEHFVYHSVLHPQTQSMPHHWNKLRVEDLLFESGLRYTIVQPAPYMQNVLTEWTSIIEQGVYRVPYSIDAPFSLVDLLDVAQAAAAILFDSSHIGATYELAGPEVLTPAQIAATLSQVLQQPVRAEQTDLDSWRERARASGMTAFGVDTLTRMFGYYDRFGLWGNSRVLAGLLGRSPNRLAAFAQRISRGQEP